MRGKSARTIAAVGLIAMLRLASGRASEGVRIPLGGWAQPGANMGKSPRRGQKIAANKRTGGRPKAQPRGDTDHKVLHRIADALERLAPRAPSGPDFSAAEAFVWHPEGPNARPRAPHQPGRDVATQGHRSGARSPGRKYRTVRARPASEQCAAVGRARHGKVVAGQGRPRRSRCRASQRRASAHRDLPRRHRARCPN